MCLSATDPIIRTATNSSVHFIAKSEAKDHLVDHHNRMPIKSAICDGLLWLALNLEHANLPFFLLMRLRNFCHNIFYALLVANSPLNLKCTANRYLHRFKQFSFLLNHTSVSHYSHFYFGRENDILHSTQGVLYRNDTSVMQSLLLKGSFSSKPVPTNWKRAVIYSSVRLKILFLRKFGVSNLTAKIAGLICLSTCFPFFP